MRKQLVLLLLGVMLFADNTKEGQMQQKMIELERITTTIQRAGLYNDLGTMKKNLIALRKNIAFIKGVEAKHFLPKHQKYAYKFAAERAKMIDMYAKDMTEAIKANNLNEAIDDFAEILRQCYSCHIRLRNW